MHETSSTLVLPSSTADNQTKLSFNGIVSAFPSIRSLLTTTVVAVRCHAQMWQCCFKNHWLEPLRRMNSGPPWTASRFIVAWSLSAKRLNS